VHTNRAINIGITFSQAFNRRSIVSANTNTQEMPDTARPRSIQRCVE
jgi:hypothetical protein